ncbi:MAG: thermonuclease family protein, partial [Alphaproteobacteria bacterium]
MKPPWNCLIALTALFALGAADSRAQGLDTLTPGGRATVVEVVDGDTVVLDDGRQVRLVGIQAPKLPLGRRGFRKWPLADDSRAALEALVLGRAVTLGSGGRRLDRHGRALAHLVLDDGRWVQGALLAQGLARVYSFADNRALVAEMLNHEAAARGAGLGIWGNSWYAIRDVGETPRHLGTFQLVEGTVLDAAEVRGTVYLNFGADWRDDFTVSLRPAAARLVRKAGLDPLALAGAR